RFPRCCSSAATLSLRPPPCEIPSASWQANCPTPASVAKPSPPAWPTSSLCKRSAAGSQPLPRQSPDGSAPSTTHESAGHSKRSTTAPDTNGISTDSLGSQPCPDPRSARASPDSSAKHQSLISLAGG